MQSCSMISNLVHNYLSVQQYKWVWHISEGAYEGAGKADSRGNDEKIYSLSTCT